jgi:hypothetical protein
MRMQQFLLAAQVPRQDLNELLVVKRLREDRHIAAVGRQDALIGVAADENIGDVAGAQCGRHGKAVLARKIDVEHGAV